MLTLANLLSAFGKFIWVSHRLVLAPLAQQYQWSSATAEEPLVFGARQQSSVCVQGRMGRPAEPLREAEMKSGCWQFAHSCLPQGSGCVHRGLLWL